jgi:DNA-binding CsgD family transcriptional regulator
MLTTFELDEYVYESLRAGASGFLLKDVPADQLVAGIRVVAEGEALLAPSVTKRLIQDFSAARAAKAMEENPPAGLNELTTREMEVFKLIARGMSNHEIATELVVSETTVKTHVARILMKLGLRDRVQAVVLAYESGLVQPGAGCLQAEFDMGSGGEKRRPVRWPPRLVACLTHLRPRPRRPTQGCQIAFWTLSPKRCLRVAPRPSPCSAG